MTVAIYQGILNNCINHMNAFYKILKIYFTKADMQYFKIIIFIYAYIYANIERMKAPIY